jgi:hypothetical protein
MTWNLETAKKRLGIPDDDDSKDADINGAMATSTALAETYCDRHIREVTLSADFDNVTRRTILLRAFPVKAIARITRNPGGDMAEDIGPAEYVLNKTTGAVTGPFSSRVLTIDYTGGYDVYTMPPELEFALWLLFDAVWFSTPGAGASTGSTDDTGPIKSFTINGVRMDYATDSASSGGGAGDALGIIPLNAAAVLERYKWHTVMGGA